MFIRSKKKNWMVIGEIIVPKNISSDETIEIKKLFNRSNNKSFSPDKHNFVQAN